MTDEFLPADISGAPLPLSGWKEKCFVRLLLTSSPELISFWTSTFAVLTNCYSGTVCSFVLHKWFLMRKI